MGPQNKNIANFSVFSCKSNSRITRIVSLSSNAYLYPFLPNDHHAIAQNAYLCPSLPNDHHAYQLSDLISRILSLFACLDLKDLMIRVCHSLMNRQITEFGFFEKINFLILGGPKKLFEPLKPLFWGGHTSKTFLSELWFWSYRWEKKQFLA